MEKEDFISFNNVSFRYEDGMGEGFNNINLQIYKGECLAVVGRSGCGKSTLLKLLAGILKPTKGELLLNKKAIQIGDMAYMPQKDLLLARKTVYDNIRISALLNPKHKINENDTIKWLDRAGILSKKDMYPSELSGGMRQRVAFVRTILTGKEVLLLDEPFGALDYLTKRDMQLWLIHMKKALSQTIVVITHDLEEALLLGDRVFVMNIEKEWEEPINSNIGDKLDFNIRYRSDFIELRKMLEEKFYNNKI